MANSDPFSNPQNLIDWAKEDTASGEAILRAFFEGGDNIAELIYEEEGTGDRLYVSRILNPLPTEAVKNFTNALNNARNSFDQSLHAACAAIGKQFKKDAHYPWADNPDPSLTYRLRHKKTGEELIPAEFWGVIRAQHPYPTGDSYPGGDNLIRDVSVLANRKHSIGLSVTGKVSGVQLAPGYLKANGGRISIPNPEWDPVKNEIILIRSSGPVQWNHQANIAFDVCFDTPPPLGAIQAHLALGAFINKAQEVLDTLKAHALSIKRA